MRIRDWVFILSAVIIGVVFGMTLAANGAEIRFENCTPGAWIGGVKWVWGENGVGVHKGADYVDVLGLELKDVGSLVVDLEPGDYAITHYQPRMNVILPNDASVMIPSKIIEFREIKVTDKSVTYTFGCRE